ncbi:DNA (cytosine-5-)-methyltransferase [Hoeflea sp. G2-23]|uniref:Cytosine-specific methyltransferase n=1 Tax=Hoeflea algicola TaxID=2983763 RepID=A0ABT3ZCT9_9HYPH|nr:DNA (cytosine-5-)-methyltransferase [Hoeflea algicola]MCY0149606.1 DNA (cytosine-5-)-methyltransferase [Hoeflea algicola]
MTTATNNTPKMKPGAKMRVISLCTGIGGDVAAFRQAGISHEMVAMAEFDPLAAAVLAQKFPDIRNLGDITAIDNWKDYYGQVDLLIAGIPCQPYSAAGRQRGTNDTRDLSQEVLRIVKTVAPKVILIENVPQFATVDEGRPFRAFTNGLRDSTYTTGHRVIDASDFVAQRRRRLFLCGHRGDAGTSPDALLALAAGSTGSAQAGGEAPVSPSSVFAGGTAVLHPARLGTLMASGSGMNRAGMKGHEMDFLVVQEFPERGLVVRRPTPLEALRAQGFPDNWLDGLSFRGRPLRDIEKYRLVGNSWPVPVTAAILSQMDRHWMNPD